VPKNGRQELKPPGNLREALNFIEQTAKRLNGAGPLEYTVLHACLLNYPHPGMTPDELARNRSTARRMLTELHKQVSSASSESDWAKLRGVGTDVDIFLDLAKMWQDESIEVAVGAYQTAVSVGVDHEGDKDKDGKVDMKAVKIGSNLGALYALQGNLEGAEARYQEALQKIAGESGGEAEMMRTVLAFNLGRAYEEEGEVVKASQWYRDVLRQHPEHMECEFPGCNMASKSSS
jgi:RNA polymerase-associated protein CTR9